MQPTAQAVGEGGELSQPQWGGRRLMNHIPRLYAIVDAALFGRTSELVAFSEELAAGGCTLLQYRNKSANTRVMLEQARELRRQCRTEPALSLPKGVSDPHVKLMMNDRADLCLAAEFDGV